jgi:SAM-dependent methyltransferase
MSSKAVYSSPRFVVETSKEVWDREYDTFRVIPSSTRRMPSKALLLFSEILNFERIGRVLDAGCGPGRNSIYLAKKGCQVDAIDFSRVALNELQIEAAKADVAHKISSRYCELEHPLPFDNSSHELALDSYVSCHFDTGLRQHYLSELARVLKPGGFLFSTQFSVDDEYYRALLREGSNGRRVITDPNNGVTKALYTDEQAKELFSQLFSLVHFVRFEFEDVVLGEIYRRVVLAIALRKKS